MSRDPEVYLRDILEAINRIQVYTKGLSEAKFQADTLRQDAVIRNLEVLGEAVKQIPEEIRKSYPDVEWRKMAGLRDILIHQYFGIDVEVLWDVVANKLPGVEAGIRKILHGFRDEKD
jgi:uncharacterized protein with HEPN domain